MSEPDATPVEVRLWVEVLDRLDADLSQAEALIGGADAIPAPVWEPDSTMPGIPESLVERARDLLDRQSALLDRLNVARIATRSQLRYVVVDAARGFGGGPRFFDQRA